MTWTLIIFLMNTEFVHGEIVKIYSSERACMIAGEKMVKEYKRHHVESTFSCANEKFLENKDGNN